MAPRPALPPRDRKWSLGLIGASLLLVGAGWWTAPGGAVPALAGLGLLGLLLNHVWWRVPFFPYDRILSAFSAGGVVWHKEPGIRLDVGGLHSSCQVYYPSVVDLGGSYRMYYRAGGYDSVIASAVSDDGLAWREEAGVRLNAGGAHGLKTIDASCATARSGGGWRLYFAAHDGRFWRLYRADSNDGLDWGATALCLDWSGKEDFCHAKDPWVVDDGGRSRLYFIGLSSTGKTQIFTCLADGEGTWGPCQSCLDAGPGQLRSPYVMPKPGQGFVMYYAEYSATSALSIEAEIRCAVSDDGVRWEPQAEGGLRPGGRYDRQGVFCPCIVPVPGGWRMYYGGFYQRHWLFPLTWASYRRFRRRSGASQDAPQKIRVASGQTAGAPKQQAIGKGAATDQ